MLGGMDHPWRRLRALTDWLLGWAELPDGYAGVTDFAHKTIWLDHRLSQASRRSVLAHELEHVERRIVARDPVLRAREEEAVNRAAARRLISIRQLGEALAWTMDLDEVAAECWVDRATLEARLRGLHPAEVHYLKRRLEHHEVPT